MYTTAGLMDLNICSLFVRCVAGSGKVSLHVQAQIKAKRSKPYESNLLRVFEVTKTGISVYGASRIYSVPESTLCDRTWGNVPLEIYMGPERIFSHEEENIKLVEHCLQWLI